MDLQSQLRIYGEGLQKKGSKLLKSLRWKVEATKRRIGVLRRKYDVGSVVELTMAEVEYYWLLKQEKCFGSKGLRCFFFLKTGDVNTCAFHMVANRRKAKQKIEKL